MYHLCIYNNIYRVYSAFLNVLRNFEKDALLFNLKLREALLCKIEVLLQNGIFSKTASLLDLVHFRKTNPLPKMIVE